MKIRKEIILFILNVYDRYERQILKNMIFKINFFLKKDKFQIHKCSENTNFRYMNVEKRFKKS
jgi:hypothetical protein